MLEQQIAQQIREMGLDRADAVTVTVSPYAYERIVKEGMFRDEHVTGQNALLFLRPVVTLEVDFLMLAYEFRVEVPAIGKERVA